MCAMMVNDPIALSQLQEEKRSKDVCNIVVSFLIMCCKRFLLSSLISVGFTSEQPALGRCGQFSSPKFMHLWTKPQTWLCGCGCGCGCWCECKSANRMGMDMRIQMQARVQDTNVECEDVMRMLTQS